MSSSTRSNEWLIGSRSNVLTCVESETVEAVKMILFLLFVCLLLVLPAQSNSTATVFESKSLPQNYLMASVGNGYIATVVYSDTVYLSGLFNGRGTTAPSHRARIPSTCDIQVRTNVPGKKEEVWSLDVSQGVFKYLLTAVNFTLKQNVYAHRVRQHVIVSEVSVSNSMNEDIQIAFDTNFNPTSQDIDFKMVSPSKMLKLNHFFPSTQNTYKAMQGYIKETEEPDSPRLGVAVVWTGVPRDPITVQRLSSSKWYFVTSISSSLNTKNFLQDAYTSYVSAMNDLDNLLGIHTKAWQEIWDQGRIELDGNLPLAQALYGSLYYILSSIRTSWPYGLSPGGLATNGYNGHTFWDQETWMYPPLLMFFPDYARSCLEYRLNRLQVAKNRAKQRSYQGAMYPWESAVTGNEVCPGQIYADYEQHITGDIGIAAKQYWLATHDVQWLKEKGVDLIYSIAEFWASRVTLNQSKGEYVIYNVMPPDEDRGVVNNSVYTNVIAKLNLEFAIKMIKNTPKNWKKIAENLYIPFDEQRQYHPEYEGYKLDITVKQADVILLGFPLMYNMSSQIRKNDLTIYEPRTEPDGPAMTKSMFALNWLEVGQLARAEASFNKSYLNVQEPFKVWTETPGGGAVNFITGAGGFLQAVMFGYAGFKLRESYLEFQPRLLPGTSKVKIVGLNYLGNSIDVIIALTSSNLTVTSRQSSSPVLEAVVQSSQRKYVLDVGQTIVLPNTLTWIQNNTHN